VWLIAGDRLRNPRQAVLGVAVAIAAVYAVRAWGSGTDEAPLARARNFYGIVSVWDDNEPWYPAPCRIMLSGHITHGRQFVEPSRRNTPLSYYGHGTGVARAATALRGKPQARFGIVGLGVGTLAAFVDPGQSARFYEINPDVQRFANEYFWFLRDCRGKAEVVLGDGRLSLEREARQRFDLLVLDAFTGDAIPVHLLTREAMDLYQRHLSPEGIIAFNITNTFLDLEPVVRGLAEHAGMNWTRIATPDDPDTLANRADWMLVTRNEAFLAANRPQPPPDARRESAALLWTDHQSNLFEILR
ncbi:MAG TPA: fused MFS/spermidine synthase, partial [Pirellulales bacterium]|nr:fused MFS/spermidine synthase [Pirellulales bacterium]